ncbi:hypothetical protein [Sporomusa acidovorans]|uniref:Lipoprotein n=1 Tax=Sporomusa acidovorans (strain ATCC 49682 / DSM 3132 / Mol) TaxID=1123286 RepID=A0ABZ3IWZ7_SPOA4|nr:hypothetical protein [Sporomusa acidovorans]OZC23329.1 hypothetical protein SPACI_07410 [Sporomusa acidovorans DSM 3132]SDE42016.1 hypothetical protein SAMN04488499_101343 [Sporomusa acidovorans]
MKKQKIAIGAFAIVIVMSLAAGCGSNDKPAATQQPAAQQNSGHDMSMMNMPKEDPMPMMKDMDKALQDMVKQVKAGQTMDAQRNAAQLVSTTDKVMPHMMDDSLKGQLRKAAADIKDSVNSGKTDPSALEGKVKAMQDIMKQTTTHLQSMSHN